MEPAGEEVELLVLAQARAKKLLDELLARQADLEQNPSAAIDPAARRLGQRVLADAVASARRCLDRLDAATARPPTSTH